MSFFDETIKYYCILYKANINVVDKIEHECFRIDDHQERFTKRYVAHTLKTETIQKYGWTCPTFELIKNISNFNKFNTIISIGSGIGFIEFLLEKNCRVLSYDLYTDYEMQNENIRFFKKPIKADGIEMAKETKDDDTLLLCWPGKEFASETLKNFNGNKLVYIGEGGGGCCADDDFFIETRKNWIEIKDMTLPSWFHTYNNAYFFIRKKDIDSDLKGKKLKNRKRYIRRYIKYNKDLTKI